MMQLLFVQGTSWEDHIIRWGQSFRSPQYKDFTHVAILFDGQLYESGGRHGVRTAPKDAYAAFKTETIPYACDTDEEVAAKAFAASCLGRSYDWVEIASIGISLLTGCALNLTSQRTLICSEYVGRILEHAGMVLARDPSNTSPAQLRAMFS